MKFGTNSLVCDGVNKFYDFLLGRTIENIKTIQYPELLGYKEIDILFSSGSELKIVVGKKGEGLTFFCKGES